MSPLALVLAVVIGMSLGLLGGGGSILTVPTFVYVSGFAAKSAVAMSLPVVGAASLLGAAGHWRAGNVNLRAGVTFGVIAMAGAFAGAKAAAFVRGEVQLALLAVVMLGAAVAMVRDRRDLQDEVGGGRSAVPIPVLAAAALGVGLLTGLVGIGGGFLVVPALVLLARIPMKQAIGTSLLVIAMNSVAGLAGYLGTVAIDWPYVALFTGVAMAGIVMGTALTRFASPRALRRGFAGLLVVMAGFLLYQNLGTR